MGNHQHIKNSSDPLREKILKVTATFSVPARTTKINAWPTFEKRIPRLSGNDINIDFSFYLKIAASLLVIALAALTVYNFQEVQVLTGNGEHQIITLPDHSTVVLNVGSTLQYNALLFAFTRKVYFTGEGFFSIRKGSRFRVVSDRVSIEVLGTKFNVISRSNSYEVACVEGKVGVSNSVNTSSVILTAGLHTVLSNDSLQQPATFRSEITAWTNGEFYFENASLHEVLNTLKLQYNITIHIDDSTSRSYTGYFANRNLEESLKLICLPLSLNYEIVNNKEVIISTKK